MKYSPTCTPRYTCFAFWWPTCVCKPSNLGINNFSQCSTTLQTLHLTILNLPSSPITTFTYSNWVAQISWNTWFNSHSFLQIFLSAELLGDGASTSWSPSLAVPKVETPLAPPFIKLKTKPIGVGPHNNTYGRAFLPSLVSRGEEEKNHLHLKLSSNFKGSTWCFSFKTKKF